jgi:hypothetical protein
MAMESRQLEIAELRPYPPRMRILAGVVAFLLIPIGTVGAQQPVPALKIVVLEGEGGVNIIQQKTAVRPLIEVRDRNNVPVSGALVTFTIGGGNSAAFAGGAQTLTVTTNAAGQAAASGLNAISSGPFQIRVQAAYQGQLATAAISLTNFATAAAAAQAGAGAGAVGGGTASGAAGGAAGGGGGISATTIGIVGAAIAGGAVAATQVAGKKEEDKGTGFDPYTGSFSGQVVIIVSFTTPEGVPGSCTRTRAMTGTMTVDLNADHATGTVGLQSAQNETGVTGTCLPGPTVNLTVPRQPVTGGPSELTFTHTASFGTAETDVLTFKGAHSGTTITGTLRLDVTDTSGSRSTGSGSTTMQVTLQKQTP